MANAVAVFTLVMATGGLSISMAVLVFSGGLAPELSRAVGAFVVAGGVMAMWIAARSRIVPVATIVQDGPAIVVAAVAADLLARDGSTHAVSAFVLLGLTTALTGTTMWLLGHYRLGGLVRYMPTTVVAAFIAGTGWLLLKGGFEVMVGFDVAIAELPDLFDAGIMKFWLPGFLVGMAAWLVSRSARLPAYSVGVVIMVCIAIFYLIASTSSSIAQIEDDGWLVGPFPAAAGISPISAADLGDADWSGLVRSFPGVMSVVGLSIVALLLNLSGISSQISTRIDADAELRTAGAANLLVAWLGASPGFHAMGDTVLLDRIGATRRAVPLVTGGILVCLGFVGVGAIGYIPRLVIGALLVMVGVSLIENWLLGLRRTVSLAERVLSVGILVVIAWLGILEGIGAGLVAACAIFIVRYSRVDPVRAVATGRRLRSRVDRPPEEMKVLESGGDRVAIFQLQGYLFFGSLTSLESRVRDRILDDRGEVMLDAIVLDFQNVTGIDASGYSVIARLLSEIADLDVVAVTSSVEAKSFVALQAALHAAQKQVVFAASMDEALEHCEELMLAGLDTNSAEGLVLTLSRELLQEFEAAEFAAGSIVMAQGSAPDGMLVVEVGSLTAFRVLEDDTRQRLRRFGANTIVGEIGVISGTQRTAEIVADSTVHAHWMPADRYRELRRRKPELIIELHEFIMRVQAERVVSLSAGLAQTLD